MTTELMPSAQHRHSSGQLVRLDWSTLTKAFEVACLVRSTGAIGLAKVPQRWPQSTPDVLVAEFNQPIAGQRMTHLLRELDLPVTEDQAVAGLRRRYTLHRVHIPQSAYSDYAALRMTAWRQAREVILTPAPVGVSTTRNQWRPRLASAAWRSVLCAAGRHVRKHMLGVRVHDHEFAAVLVRSAQLLGARASLQRRSGCFLVCVPDGPDKDRVMMSSATVAITESAAVA